MKKLGLNTIIISLGMVLPKIIMVVLLPLYTKYLTTDEYGIYDLFCNLAVLILPIVSLQIQTGAYKLLKKEKNENEISKIISSSSKLVFQNIIIMFLICLIIKVVSNFNLLFFIYYAVYIIYNYLLEITRGFSLERKYSIACFINILFFSIGSLTLLIYFKMGLDGAIIALIIGYISAIIYQIFSLKIFKYIKFDFIDKKITKKMLKFSLPLIPNSLSWWIINVSDRIMISLMLGLSSNGIYAIANKLPSIYSLFNSAFNLSWQSSAIENENKEHYERTYCLVSSFLFNVLGIVLASLPILFSILVDVKFLEALKYMPILLISLFFSSLSTYFGGIYLAKEMTKKIGLTTFMAAIINIMINLIFMKKFGVIVACISTLTAYMWLYIYRKYELKNIYDYNFKFNFTLSEICMVICSLVIFFMNNIFLNVIVIILYTIFMLIKYKHILIDILIKLNVIKK